MLGMDEALPFRDKSFDFVIASHVLAYSADPENFLLEFHRVAKVSYIETPDAFTEKRSVINGVQCRSRVSA